MKTVHGLLVSNEVRYILSFRQNNSARASFFVAESHSYISITLTFITRTIEIILGYFPSIQTKRNEAILLVKNDASTKIDQWNGFILFRNNTEP